jgi:hypothetical protein
MAASAGVFRRGGSWLEKPAFARTLSKCACDLILILDQAFRDGGGKSLSMEKVRLVSKLYVTAGGGHWVRSRKRCVHAEINKLMPFRDFEFRINDFREKLKDILQRHRYDERQAPEKSDQGGPHGDLVEDVVEDVLVDALEGLAVDGVSQMAFGAGFGAEPAAPETTAQMVTHDAAATAVPIANSETTTIEATGSTPIQKSPGDANESVEPKLEVDPEDEEDLEALDQATTTTGTDEDESTCDDDDDDDSDGTHMYDGTGYTFDDY